MVRIVSLPFTDGNPVIRSMVTLWNGHTFSVVGIQYVGAILQCVSIVLLAYGASLDIFYYPLLHPRPIVPFLGFL
jgi:hypothetical protein